MRNNGVLINGLFRRLKERVTKPKAAVALSLSKSAFTLGEDLEGTSLVTSEEEFNATEVGAEFRCVERRKRGDTSGMSGLSATSGRSIGERSPSIPRM